MYCLHLEPRSAPPKPVPWRERPEVWIAVLLPVAAYLWYSETHLDVAPVLYNHVGPALFQTGWTLYLTTIQMPLAELYRQGPWLLGWEGDSLPRICSRITFHGDASFWMRNMEECVITTILRFIMRERAQHKLNMAAQLRGPPTDLDMVETYRAFQTIIKQVGRTLGGPAATAQPLAQGQGPGNRQR
jgi:hypothetical protein